METDRDAPQGNLSQSHVASVWGWTRNALWKGLLTFSLGSDHKKVPRWRAQTISLHFISQIPTVGRFGPIHHCHTRVHPTVPPEYRYGGIVEELFWLILATSKSFLDSQWVDCPVLINLVLFAFTYQTYHLTTAWATFSFCLMTHSAVCLSSTFSLIDFYAGKESAIKAFK